MKRYNILLLGMLSAIIVAGCRKSSPTVFIKGMSVYIKDYDRPYSYHNFEVLSASPNKKPTININNRTVPDDRIYSSLGDYYAWDTLPSVSPNAEVELKVTYYNINEEKKEASSKVKLPSEPTGMSVSVRGGEVNVSWGKPDSKSTDFEYVSIEAICTDGSIFQYASWDTVITDIENTTSVTKTLGSLCKEIGTIVYAEVYSAVVNIKGPWNGDKDNIKGAKGQYYGGAGKGDTTSYLPAPTSMNFKAPKVDWTKVNLSERIMKAIDRFIGMPYDEGEWIGW